jgi:hypothetical protein
MNAKIKHSSVRLAKLFLCSASLISAFGRPASAHDIEVRPQVSHHYYYGHTRPIAYPRWMQKDRDFQRWYLRSDYRYIRGANWASIYDLYLLEKRHRRHRHNRFHGKVYIDLSQPPHRRYQ